MSASPITGHGRIRRSAIFVLAALGVETLSLGWRHPLSVYFFLIAGGLCAVLAILSFLLSFVSRSAESEYWQPVDDEEREDRAAEG